MHPLAGLQRGIESLYRIATGVDVGDFMVEASDRDRLAPERRPREQLLVREDDGELAIGLFIDPDTLANLVRHDPRRALDARNFGDFVLAVEGVSHFVYTVWCAGRDRAVSPLELELQAEIDKWVTCLLATEPEAETSAALRRRLYHDVDYEPDLDADEHDRYRAANDNASRYTAWLEQAFVGPRRIPAMLDELRRFYRRPLAGKLAAAAQASGFRLQASGL